MSTAPLDIQAAHLLLQELRQLQRTVAEAQSARRLNALDCVQDAIRSIGEIGTSAGVLDRAAEELGVAHRFHRVLISEVEGQILIPRRLWSSEPGPQANALSKQLEGLEIPLVYPLIEAEIAAHPRTGPVAVSASGPRSPAKLHALLRWDRYVVSAIGLRGKAIGILHAQPSPEEQSDEELDRLIVSAYADGLARAFERMALADTLRRHHQEMRVAIAWIGDRLAAPTDHLATPLEIGHHAKPNAAERIQMPNGGDTPPEASNVDTLTPRESEILGLLGRGHTNASIAQSLLISQSTVKFHVKNILLKLGATSRADAVARHMRGGN